MEEKHQRVIERVNQPQDPELKILSLQNFQNNLQPRDVSEDDVSYQRMYLTNLILPVTVLALSIFLVLFIFSIIFLWFRSYYTSWSRKKNEKYSTNSDVRFVSTMAQYDNKDPTKLFKVLVDNIPNIDLSISSPKPSVECKLQPCENVEIPSDVKYIDERSDHRLFFIKPIVTRNYGGSSPKFPDDENKDNTKKLNEDKTKDGASKFVFPSHTQSQEFDSPDNAIAGPSKSKSPERLTGVNVKNVIESKCGRFKIAIPEQKWGMGNSNPSFEYKKYSVNMPKPFQLVEAVKIEPGKELLEKRAKTFSLTRSPSLEKDDKSPFVSSAKSDRSDVFGFDEKVIKENVSNLNINTATILPKPVTSKKVLMKSMSVNNENLNTTTKYSNTNEEPSDIRRICSINTKLNMCIVSDGKNIEYQPEHSEMQSSPQILESSSAKEKYSGTRFNFSPKVTGNQSPRFFPSDQPTSPKFFSPAPADKQCSPTPKFFTPLENQSPKFFPLEKVTSPKYYTPCEKHGSPKFFSDRSLDRQSPAKFSKEPLKKVNEYKETRSFHPPISPKLLTRSSSPKFSDKGQLSPKVLINCACRTPKSPKISNKENYFKFERSVSVDAKKERIELEKIDQGQKSNRTPRYQGRKSIEREHFEQVPEHRKYKRYNSTDSCKKISRELSFINDYRAKTTENNHSDDTRREVVENDVLSTNTVHINNLNNNKNGISTPDMLAIGNDVVDFIEPTKSYIYEATVEVSYKSDPVLDQNTSPNVSIESDTAEEKFDTAGILDLPGSENYRRQRLKSISLDSDNAKIIEQNLSIPIAKHLKQENLSTVYLDREIRTSCYDSKQIKTCKNTSGQMGDARFTFDQTDISDKDETDLELVQDVERDCQYSPDLDARKSRLRDSADTKSLIDMPRFSPKEFEVVITPDDSMYEQVSKPFVKGSKNLHNLRIELNKHDSDLQLELLEFEKLYTAEKRLTPKTPTLKIKATSLDSSESINLSLPQEKTLQVPQNSISVPNTPKRQSRRFDKRSKCMLMLKTHGAAESGTKITSNTSQIRRRSESGFFLRENNANLTLYEDRLRPKVIGGGRMGSFDENMGDLSESPPEINVSNEYDNRLFSAVKYPETAVTHLGSNLLNFKQNLSLSSTNLKTLPEGVPSIDFEPAVDDIVTKRNMLQRRGSNQSLPSSNCSLTSIGMSCHNLPSLKNSLSNFSINSDRQRTAKFPSSDQQNRGQPVKKCLLQRRGSNNSLTLNIKNSNTNLSRYLSNSSLNIHHETKVGDSKGLLERRSSNTSLTLNINNSNPQLAMKSGLSVSNYNLDASNYNWSQYNSNQSINTNTDHKKGLLERRASNTSLTLNINSNLINTVNPDLPREIEINNPVDQDLKDNANTYTRDKHRKSLSTENLLPKSYKNRVLGLKNVENLCLFGSHDDLWSSSLVTDKNSSYQAQNLTYVGGDQDNEMIYAFGDRTNIEAANFNSQGFVRNITTKPLSPQTTSEDFKMYIANIQHLQSASNMLTRSQLKYLNGVFQNGYSKVKCSEDHDSANCSGTIIDKDENGDDGNETIVPCSQYQKKLLRSLHQEFWDLPQNHQEKPMVFGSHIKNRYKTILPNEHSRVILKADCGKKLEGYINANFIKSHDNTKNSFIATQGPLPNTLYDFWLMVLQNSSKCMQPSAKTNIQQDLEHENSEPALPTYNNKDCVQKIVMLANFIENNKQKCEKYFPLELNEEITLENQTISDNSDKFICESVSESKDTDSIVILNVGIIKKTGYTIRKLVVCYKHIAGNTPNINVDSETTKIDDKFVINKPSVINDGNDTLLCNNESVDLSYFKDDIGDDSVKLSDKAKNVCKVTDNIPKISQNEKEERLILYHYWFHNWADHKCPNDVDALLNFSLDVLSDSEYHFKTEEPTDNDFTVDKLSDTLCECSLKDEMQADTKFMFPPLQLSTSQDKTSLKDSQDKLQLVNLSSLSQIESPPIIVHCSAGIGRTGCLIGILNGIKQLQADNKVDILGIVCNMRLNRGGMVQNSEQYELIHKVLCLYEEIGLSP